MRVKNPITILEMNFHYLLLKEEIQVQYGKMDNKIRQPIMSPTKKLDYIGPLIVYVLVDSFFCRAVVAAASTLMWAIR